MNQLGPKVARTQTGRTVRMGRAVASTARLFLLVPARACVLVVLCLAPWWLGGVEPDVQVWLDLGLLVALSLWTLLATIESLNGYLLPTPLPSLMLPICGVLFLGAYQMLPKPPMSHVVLPDAGYEVADATSHNIENAGNNRSAVPLLRGRSASYSLSPAATRLELARIGIAVLACFLGIVLFSTPASRVWLWGSLALNGAALAFFGIVQQLSWNGKLFWTVPLLLGGQPFASYVNRNNAAGYLNLCLACAAGWAIWSVTRQSNSEYGRTTLSDLGTLDGRVERVHRFDLFDGRMYTALMCATLIAAGIICSLSRGGVLALLAATVAATLLLCRTWGRLPVGVFFAGILVAGAGLVYWAGMESRIVGRWQSPRGDSLVQGAQTRLANWRDAMHSVRDFPVTGTGFGTYRYAYLPYESWPAPVRFHNADNQFVETLVEGGFIGGGLLLASIGLTLLASLYLTWRTPRDPIGLVGVLVVVSQCVSAFFDFGPAMTANMLTLAVLCGVVTGSAAELASVTVQGTLRRSLTLPELRPVGLMACMGVVLLVHGGLGVHEIISAAESRVVRRSLPRRLDDPGSLDMPSLKLALHELTTVVQHRPDDAEAHAALARLWMYRYRLEAWNLLKDQQQVGGPTADWTRTELANLYRSANLFREQGREDQLEELRRLPVVRTNLLPAWEHLQAAQATCPLMPDLDIPLALLSFVSDSRQTTGEAALRRAIQMAPSDPDLLETCGRLAQLAGMTDFARHCWRQCLQIEPDRFSKIVLHLPKDRSLAVHLEELLPDSPTVWTSIALSQLMGDEHRLERRLLAHRAELLLKDSASARSQLSQLRELARVNRLLDEPVVAQDLYRQAIALDPLNVDLRIELVNALKAQQQWRLALEQAELSRSLDPGRVSLSHMVRELQDLCIRTAKVEK